MKEKRFEIVVENVEKLFKQFSNSHTKICDLKGNIFQREFELIKTSLAFPIKEIFVQGNSNGSTYQLRAMIMAQNKLFSLVNVKKPKFSIPQKKLAKNFNLSLRNRVVFVLNKKREEEFAISHGKIPFEFIEITVGHQFEIFGGFSTPDKVISHQEAFKKDLWKFARIIEVVLTGIYEKNNWEPPRTRLYLRPDSSIPKEEPSKENNLAENTNNLPVKSVIQVEKTEISFSDIGGQKEGKKEIQGISFALKNPGLYKHWGTKPPKGVLLFGPPGTGKTLMAKALATEARANFYNIKVSDMTSKWYGESEKRMQAVFDVAKKNGPSIIFFDEIDAIASQRDSSHEATQRVVSTLLQNLDGIESIENIIVVASTNRLDAVDPAIKRPGRIDRLVEVPLPDDEGREHILRIHFAKAEKTARRYLFNEIDIDRLVALTKGMNGADLAEITRRTLEEKVRKAGNGENPTLVSTEDIVLEIEKYERLVKTKQAIGFTATLQDKKTSPQ